MSSQSVMNSVFVRTRLVLIRHLKRGGACETGMSFDRSGVVEVLLVLGFDVFVLGFQVRRVSILSLEPRKTGF